MLIVADTEFNLKTPLLIGTNLIRRCKDDCVDKHGPCYLQEIKADGAWSLAYKCLDNRERVMRKYSPDVKVRNLDNGKHLVVQSQRSTVLLATVKTRKVGGRLTAVVDETESQLPKPLKVIPSLTEIEMNGKDQLIPVETWNPTDKPVSLQPRTIVGVLKSAAVVSGVSEGSRSEVEPQPEVNKTMDVTFPDHMTEDQKGQASQLLQEWNTRVFAQSDFDLGRTGNMKHAIPLYDNQPFKQRHQRLPPAQYDEV